MGASCHCEWRSSVASNSAARSRARSRYSALRAPLTGNGECFQRTAAASASRDRHKATESVRSSWRYACIARRTTRRAVAGAAAVGAAAAGASAYSGSGCVQVVDSYGRVTTRCP
jgi:hypothetical protein